jgi:hypothetical protein
MMMFSTRPVELYHGSNTGADNGVLDSFRRRGVVPDMASGHGQGRGFYVWSDRKSAASHAKAILGDPTITTNARTDGSPMVVTIKAVMEPDRWDLDYEMNKRKMIEWLHDNHEMANEIMGSEDVRIKNRFQREVPDDRGEWANSKGVQFLTPGGSMSTHYARSEGGMRAGELVGAIMNKIQKKDPATVHRFEELFFANMGPGVAVKYVGSEPLKPKRIEVFRDGRWDEA